jgi:DNA processing protein
MTISYKNSQKESSILEKKIPSDQEKFHCARLSRTQKVSPSLFFRLVNLFGSPKVAIENLEDFSIKSGCKQSIKPISKDVIKKEFDNSIALKASIVTFQDERYPSLLKEISDPPPFLTAKGKLELLNENIISIVGARNSSFAGNKFARDIARELGNHGFVTASGMARGIDTATHIGSVDTGTIAVLAGGIDNIYPRENNSLHQEICEKGVVISEMPCGFTPRGHNFLQRNRIISGVSLAVAVIEATIKSGTLTTARFAVEQNRDLFSVPGFPLDPRHHGTNKLLKEGAFMLQTYFDIISEVKPAEKSLLHFAENDKYNANTKSSNMPDDKSLKEAQQDIINQINFTPISIEEIIDQCNLPARLVNISLIQLELADRIENFRGQISLKT